MQKPLRKFPGSGVEKGWGRNAPKVLEDARMCDPMDYWEVGEYPPQVQKGPYLMLSPDKSYVLSIL